jgi:predicted transcriptional regulator
MNDFNINKLIALFLIEKYENFRSFYRLQKPLSRKFNVFPVGELLRELAAESKITTRVIDGMSYYEITEEGVRYLNHYTNEMFDALDESFPHEKEFIDALKSRA